MKPFRRIAVAAAIAALFLLFIAGTLRAAEEIVKNYSIVEVDVTNRENREKLYSRNLDVMGVKNGKAAVCVEKKDFAVLRSSKIPFRVVMENADDVFAPFKGVPDCGVYHTYQETCDELRAVAAKYPDLTKLETIGKTVEGRDIMAVRLATEKSLGADCPKVLFMGAHHAREWIGVEHVFYNLNTLIAGYGSDPAITRLLDSRVIWFVPMVNADGVTYSQTQYKMWRKNRRDNGNGVFGVDLNRNYGYLWGGVGSSADPDDETYHGRSAFSEPETMAVRSLCDRVKFSACITYHSYSELVLWPWGNTYDPTGDNALVEIGTKMGNLIGYTPQQSSDLYPTTGDTTDWLYGEKKCYAYTIELGQEFIPEEAKVAPMCKKNFAAAVFLLERAGYLVNPIVHTPKLSPATAGDGNFVCSVDRQFYPNLEVRSLELVYDLGGKEMRAGFTRDGDFYKAAPAGITSKITYHIELSDSKGNAFRYPETCDIRYNPRPAEALLVKDTRDAADAGAADLYMKSLAAAGIEADFWDIAETGRLPFDLLKGYPLCVWYFGSESKELLTMDELASIEKYLNSGMSLVLTGQDIAYSFRRSQDVLAKYLRVKFVKDNSLVFNIEGAGGFAGTKFAIGGSASQAPGEGVGNQRVPDEIDPLDGAKTVFKFAAARGVASSGSCGVRVSSYPGKLFVFTFGIEGVTDGASRVQILKKVSGTALSGEEIGKSFAKAKFAVSSQLEGRLLNVLSSQDLDPAKIDCPALSGVKNGLEERTRARVILK